MATFEENLKELEEIVLKLESGQANLEEAVATYEKGMKLKKECEEKLLSARQKIEKLILDKNDVVISKEDFNDNI